VDTPVLLLTLFTAISNTFTVSTHFSCLEKLATVITLLERCFSNTSWGSGVQLIILVRITRQKGKYYSCKVLLNAKVPQ
jgi:hypothetical protein